MFTHLIGAYTKFGTTKTDCEADLKLDGPMLKEWASIFSEPGIEGKITKNVMRHAFKFMIQFNEAKKTWDQKSYYWTGERMGSMLVVATMSKNIIYQDEIDAGIEVDFEGEDYILQ